MHDATLHVPVRQVSFEFGRVQVVPQAPQSVRVFSRVSQPSEGSLLQSPKPDVQAWMMHLPAEQVAVPFSVKHALPQPPQFATFVAVSTSHPSVALPLQSARVPPHDEIPHTLETQLAVPLPAGQTFVQLPQWSTLLDVWISQPFEASESQSWNPFAHAMEHAPSAHAATPWFVEHGVPHAPQFLMLVLRFVSQPFEARPSQSAKPSLQLAMTHLPPAHPGVPFAIEQG
jgi:hypothetical protein